MNVNDWLASNTKRLTQAGIKTARLDALIIIGEVLNASKAWLLSHPEAIIEKEQLKKADQYITRRQQYEPIAYLFRCKEFYGRTFIIDKRVLVPRPETEALIELALTLPDRRAQIADIGTGSGIIGLTLALERPNWQCTLIDNDPDCLGLARENAHKHALDTMVTFRDQDLLGGDNTHYDILIANLPYVPNSFKDQPDLRAEPPTALFSGHDGLNDYRRLFKQASERREPPRHLITESLISQHNLLAKIAGQYGYHLQQTSGLAQHFQR